MRNLVLKLARAIKKNPDFHIDGRMPTTAVLAMLWTTGLAFLRGLWRRPGSRSSACAAQQCWAC